MKRYTKITSAENAQEDVFKDSVNNLKDDFDYVLSGLDRLNRSGNLSDSLSIIQELEEHLNDVIDEIASMVQEA